MLIGKAVTWAKQSVATGAVARVAATVSRRITPFGALFVGAGGTFRVAPGSAAGEWRGFDGRRR